jgi:hypothetical protein
MPSMGHKQRIGRHGLPVKTDRIIFAVTHSEKAEIKAAAVREGVTTTEYLLRLHRKAEELRRKKGGADAK